MLESPPALLELEKPADSSVLVFLSDASHVAVEVTSMLCAVGRKSKAYPDELPFDVLEDRD